MSGGAGSGDVLCQLNKKEKWFHGKFLIFEVGIRSEFNLDLPSFSSVQSLSCVRPHGLPHDRPLRLVL